MKLARFDVTPVRDGAVSHTAALRRRSREVYGNLD